MQKGKDGKYHVKKNVFDLLVGSRAQVMHGTAYKTSGGLLKKHLKKNKYGKIVSKAKSMKGPQMLKRLRKAGYFTRKGVFGWVKKTPVRYSSKYVAKHGKKSLKAKTLKKKKKNKKKKKGKQKN